MKVRINAQSGAKGSTPSNPIPKKREDGSSGAFLVTLVDASDVDRELIEFAKVTDDGSAILPKFFRGAYEMWFSCDLTPDGKPVEGDAVSFYDAVANKLASLKNTGSSLVFEFEPRFSQNSKGQLVWGTRPDKRQFLYQTITIGFSSMGVKRFSTVEATPVEGL